MDNETHQDLLSEIENQNYILNHVNMDIGVQLKEKSITRSVCYISFFVLFASIITILMVATIHPKLAIFFSVVGAMSMYFTLLSYIHTINIDIKMEKLNNKHSEIKKLIKELEKKLKEQLKWNHSI